MTKGNDKLNQMYYDEGWGKLAEDATGLKPADVESMARSIARHAAPIIERLSSTLEGYQHTFCEGYCHRSPSN